VDRGGEPAKIALGLLKLTVPADIRALADARGEDPADVWQALVEAAEELGACSVGDAAAFVVTSRPARVMGIHAAGRLAADRDRFNVAKQPLDAILGG